MTGVCKICRQLIVGPEPCSDAMLFPATDADRHGAEFLLLGQAMQEHLSRYHPSDVMAGNQLLHVQVKFISTLYLDSADPDFEIQQQRLREVIMAQIQALRVLVSPAAGEPASASSPLMV